MARTVRARIAVAAYVVRGEIEELEAVWESDTAMTAAAEIMQAGAGVSPNVRAWVTVDLPLPNVAIVEGVVESAE